MNEKNNKAIIDICCTKKATATIQIDTIQGKSAYQIAVKHGFVGTEEEWLESLKGKDGSLVLDEELDETSKNGVENKAVATAINNLKQELDDKESDKNYIHSQDQSSALWEIEHNLNKIPSITVFDSMGNVVVGDVTYDSVDPLNKLTIKFSAPFGGRATLN